MNKKIGILSLSAVGVSLLVTSCQYTKDPNQERKDRAKTAYKEFYSKAENQSLPKDPLFYFDNETLKGVLVTSENDATYLGQLNLTNFTFSENPTRYFVDFGNIPITIDDTNDDGNPDSFSFGNYLKKDQNGQISFDVDTLYNNLPFVLHVYDPSGEVGNNVATYSMVEDGGIIPDTSNAKAYDPNYFFISDFSIKIDGLEDFTEGLLNFEGKDLAFLRNDLYTIISSLFTTADLEKVDEFLGLSSTLKNNYRKAVGIPLDQNMPSTLTVPGIHYTNFVDSREVVVGPFSFIPKILRSLLNTSDEEFRPSIYDVNTVIIGEGVKTISFYAFAGERDSETGVSKSNLKNIYLPSSLSEIQFNAFNDLDLESLYIPKTYTDVNGVKTLKAIETVDFGNADFEINFGNSTLDLSIAPSFGNTNINKIYFEDFDNLNISAFPYSTTNLTTEEAIQNSVEIYHGDYDTTKYEKLSEAFSTYDTINPFYQMVINTDLENKKYAFTCDLENLAKGKKLYLPYVQYSLSTDEARGTVSSTSYESPISEKISSDAKLTMKLEKDLTIDGELIIGAQVGLTSAGSGDIAGEFAAIDLNGHTITINNGGKILGNGLIFDSSSAKTGNIVVENGGTLTTNLTITNYAGFNEVENRGLAGVSLFDSYKFNSLKVKTTFKAGSILSTYLSYASQDFINENTFKFIGTDSSAFISLEKGELILDQKNKSLVGADSKVSINDVNLLTIVDQSSVNENSNQIFTASEVGFNLANSDLNVTLDDVYLNTFIRCESGELLFNSLTLNENAKVYSKNYDNFVLSGSINVNDNVTSTWVLGCIKVADENVFGVYKALVSGVNEGKMSYSETIPTYSDVITSNVTNLNVLYGVDASNFNKLLVKNETGYYYLYENSYRSGSLFAGSDKLMASYGANDQYWTAHDVSIDDAMQNVLTTTPVNSREMESFSNDDNTLTYVFDKNNGGSWSKLSNAENGIYTIGSSKYIKTSDESPLIKGDYYTSSPSSSSRLFIASSDNSLYVREDYSSSDQNNWVKVISYDSSYVLQSVEDNSLYFALLNGSTYSEGRNIYSASEHIVDFGGTRYAFIGDGFENFYSSSIVNMTSKTITGDIGSQFVYLDSQSSWRKVNELGETLGKNNTDDRLFFKLNNQWLESVQGEIAINTNELANYSFGVLNSPYSYNGQRYKFVMREGDSSVENTNNFELIIPQGLVNVKQEDFADIWPNNVTTTSFHAYRHVESDGKKYLFYLTDEGKIEKRQFEFAAGFTPSVPDPTNTNILTKYNFVIYKVNFYKADGTLDTNVSTIYINVDSSNDDNAIYAGDYSNVESDSYLALAVFTSKNPISSITSALS